MSTSSRSPWRPILVGDEAGRARDAIEAVAAGLLRHRAGDPAPSPTLAAGLAGDALLYAQLARSQAAGPWHDHAAAALDRAIDRLAEVPLGPALFGGFAGIAWAAGRVQRACQSNVESSAEVDSDPEDANDDIDRALRGLVETAPWSGVDDLIDGLVGIGVYALDRQRSPHGPAILGAVIARLGEHARPASSCLTWHRPPHHLPAWRREAAPHGVIDLGVAHGVPGVLALCGHAVALGVPGAAALLDGGVTGLLAARRPLGRARIARDLAIGLPDEGAPGESRIAWCYGDLGASVALLGAARRAGRADWEAEALALAGGAAARPPDGAGAFDACLCHGAGGIAHLFNRLYQATARDQFRDAARAWLGRALELADADHPLGGFRMWRRTDADTGAGDWLDSAGLLEGASGVALALSAAIEPHEPIWDRFLLADL